MPVGITILEAMRARRPRGAELLRKRHLRHLPHEAARRRSRPSRPRARRARARRPDHDLRVARALLRPRDRPVERMSARQLRIGVAGLGRAFTLMLPTLANDPRIKLVAGADPLPEARAAVRVAIRREDLCDGRGTVRRSGCRRRSMSRRRISITPSMCASRPRAASMCWSKSRWRSRSPNAAR